MADQKISELTAITGANTADDDLLVIVDTSTGETKKITKAELTTTINNALIDGAPATLDTLNELAAALADDANFASTVTTSLAGKVDTTGDSMTGDLTFGDNDKAIFGAGSDLQIYHSGTASFISENGTGDLNIQGNNLVLEDPSGNNYLFATAGGAVSLFHNASAKLATTSTGIDVTGTATMDGLTVDGGAIEVNNFLTAFNLPNNSNQYMDVARSFYVNVDSDNNSTAEAFGVTFDNRSKKALLVQETGDISFYEDTGTTAKFFWDASAESLGIGTASPNAPLSVRASSPAATVANMFDSAGFGFYFKTSNIAPYPQMLHVGGSESLAFGTNGATERMRIDSAGNVGIGTASPSAKLEVDGNTSTDGILITNPLSGSFYNAKLEFKRDSTSGGAKIQTERNAAGGVGLSFNYTASNTAEVNGAYSEAMRIDSAGNVGIGTDSPSVNLDVRNDGASGIAYLGVRGGTGGAGAIQISGNGTTYGTSSFDLFQNSSGSFVYARNNEPMIFGTNNTERMRLDSSGNLLVGTTTTAQDSAGFRVFSSGRINASDSTVPIIAARLSTDGEIIRLAKDGTTVGSIGTNGGMPYFTNPVAGYGGLRFDAYRVLPATSAGAGWDNSIDLGAGGTRFRDLYLSGGIALGGTGSANYLDDYEEGLFTLSAAPSTSGTITINPASDTFAYTKVGRQVSITGVGIISAVSSPVGSTVTLSSLPFATANLTETAGFVSVSVGLFDNSAGTWTNVVGQVSEGSSTVTLLTDASAIAANDQIALCFTYHTA